MGEQGLRVERAAGGVVVRRSRVGLEVLLIDDAYGKVTFPKGHLEPGETWEDAAVREISEETGIEARVLEPLGRVEYRIEREGVPVRKQVRLFLMEAIDESETPTPQVEEVNGAYFVPWGDACAKHRDAGYANWSWVFDKAAAQLEWHEQHLETTWRNLSADTDPGVLKKLWEDEIQPYVGRLVSAVRAELVATTGDWSSLLAPETGPGVLPREMKDGSVPADVIEHTLLKPEASAVDVGNLCRQAMDHSFHAVCVNPVHVPEAARRVAGSGVQVCTVVGFPLGATNLSALRSETQAAMDEGAVEIDMVIPVGAMREDDIWTVFRHVQAVCETAHRSPNVSVKVILETHFLSYDQVVKASLVALAAGADFLKTSTGFAPTGARIADVALMAFLAGSGAGVKAAGGIKTGKQALNFLRFGATRIGTSSGLLMTRK